MISKNYSLWFTALMMCLLAGSMACQSSDNKRKNGSEDKNQLKYSQAGSTNVELMQAWELTKGIDRPESVVYDADRNILFVSNMAGGGMTANGTGYISRISLDGKMVSEKWTTDLNAPKGLAISGRYLYTSDMHELVQIDLETGKVVKKYKAPDAKFLNDVTTDSAGNVYVSDSGDNTVYRLQDDTFEIWLKSDKIQSPNGLFAEEDRLVIAACGIESENPGSNRYLQAIDYQTLSVQPLGKKEPIGGLDAVQPNGMGGYFLTDWGAGIIMNYEADKGATLLRKISKGTADLDYVVDEKLLVVPIMMSDRIIAFEVKN